MLSRSRTGIPRAALVACALVAGTAQAQDGAALAELRARWTSGERVEAVDAATERLAARPDDAELRAQLVEWELAVHRYQSAWEHLAGLDDGFDPQRGQALYLLGRYEEALELLDGDDPVHTLARVDALEVLGRDDELPAALDRAARALGEDDPRVLSARGRFRVRRGELDAAEEAFRGALARDPLQQEARFGLGRLLVRRGDRDAGLALLEEHRRLAPLIDRRDFALQSLDLAPANAGNHAELGDVERLLGRFEEARRAYEAAERLARPEDVVPVALRFGRLYADAERFPEAIAVLDRALARVPDVRLVVRAGDYARDAGDADGARRRYRRALELRPGDPAIEERLASLP